MKGRWPINPLAGAAVPPDVDWLIGSLAKINSTSRPDETVVRHAFSISGRLLDLRHRGGGTHDPKGSIKKRLPVRPRPTDRGHANEHTPLQRAARTT